MIDLLPDDHEDAIVDAVAAYLRENLPAERLRAATWRPGEFDRWQEIASLGWFAGADPDMGVDIAAEALIFRELGRNLFSPAAISTSIAARLCRAEGREALFDAIATGKRHVALGNVVSSEERDYDVQIYDAAATSLVLIGNGDDIALWDAEAFRGRRELHSFDPGVKLEGACLAEGARPVVAAGRRAADLQDHARILTAAMCVGSAEATLELAVGYAKIRKAFGHSIAEFQAVKHHCADMALRGEEARDQLVLGALCHRDRMFDPSFQIASATLVANEAAMKNAQVCIQIHGGMGFTYECEAHFHLKRAHLLRWLWGGPHVGRKRLLAPASLYATTSSANGDSALADPSETYVSAT